MQWESLGFQSNPFTTDPIKLTTLGLYTGHNKAIKVCQNVLHERNVLLVIEGARGVGTTSFANFLRFSAQKKKQYFTPQNEIRVEAGWSPETLLAVIVANIVREIGLSQTPKIIKDKRFQDAKALSARIAETYRSFGINAFGAGVSYGKSGGIQSQPVVVPSGVLGHHLEDLAALIREAGYRYGLLLQLNNLDINEIHAPDHAKYLFNALRDYIQTDSISWLLVGDTGLRKFIAQNVDRLDDIVNYETEISPLNRKEYQALIEKRIEFYRTNKKAILPIDNDVFLYLYDITKGRLRYVFGLLQRLINSLYVGDLTDRLTLDIAKPMVINLARNRVSKNNLSPNEELLLKILVKHSGETVTFIADKMGKSMQYISKLLPKLLEKKLVMVQQHGKHRCYLPELDATIAYSQN